MIIMEKSIAEMRSAIVRYYEDRGYTHEHSEAYVPHDADQIMRVYNAIQEEKNLPPNRTRNNPLLLE